MTVSALPTPDDVDAAAARLAGAAHRTPVMTSRLLDERAGRSLFFKCENLQRVGAFKFRGAYNTIAALTPRQRARGVVAYSSGNHAQAVALAAALHDVPATIVMPTDAPAVKSAATAGYGARIVGYDRMTGDRAAIAEAVAAETGALVVPPFDHPDVIAGQGTAVAELIAEVDGLDAVVTPCGGGGLLSGALLATRARLPHARVLGVEPEAGDDVRRSLAAGERISIPQPVTIADGAATTLMGRLTFAVLSGAGAVRGVDDVVTASDDELRAWVRDVATYLKLVIEPTAALGLAAAARLPELAGARIGVVLTGGNVDLASFAR